MGDDDGIRPLDSGFRIVEEDVLATHVPVGHVVPTLEFGDARERELSPGGVRSDRAEPGRDRAAKIEQRRVGARYDTSVASTEVRATLTHDVGHAAGRR